MVMQSTRMQLNGDVLAVTEMGTGDPLLIVGGAVPPDWAQKLMAELSEDRRVINFEYIAADDWNEVADGRTQRRLGADAVALLDELEIDAADVLGYSRGAVAAFAAAVDRPERVRRLVLLAPVSPFSELLIDSTPPPLPDDPKEIEQGLTALGFSPEFIGSRPAEAAAMTRQVMTYRAPVVRVARSEEEPIDDRLPHQPVLVVTAGADRMVAADHSAALVERIEHVEHVVIEGGSHLVAWERPADVAAPIRKFLGGT